MKQKLIKLYNFSSSWTGTIIIVLFVIFFIAQAFVIPSGSMKNTLLIGDHLFVKKYVYGIPVPRIPWLEIPIMPDFRGNGHIINGPMPKRGDIVVFRYPLNEKVHYVKRNFAVGGDEVIFARDVLYLRPHEGDEFIKKNYKKDQIFTLDGKLFVKNPYSQKYKGIHYDKSVDVMPLTIKALGKNKFAMEPVYIKDLPETESIEDFGFNFNAYYKKIPDKEFFMIGDNRNHSNDSRFWGCVKYKDVVGKPWFVYFSINSNKEIRWDRIGRSVQELQTNELFIKP